MKAVITHDKLEIQDNTLYNSGSIDYYEIDTEFTSDWDNLTKYAIINGAEAVKIPVVANKVKVDRNTSGTYYIGFVGYTIDDDKKTYQISTNLQPIYFQIGAGELPAADPQDLPDPTTWEAYLNEIEAIVDGAENVNITAEKIDKTTYINVTDKTGTTETVEVLDGIDGPGVAEGGTTGQILVKKSDEDFDTEWVDNVTSYNDLTDKPSINNVELGGNKSLSDLGIKQEYTKSDVGLGNVDNIRQYSENNPPPYPVNSVNGQTGAVVIDTHDDLIPTQASSSNQLADKNFVNSSIGTATATFRGTYNSLAELEQVTADENDYGFVVGTDSAGNTVYNRYKYASGTWVFEYALNNSSFTAAQWEAIQSGITDDLVTKLQGIEAGAEVNIVEGLKIGNVTQQVSNKIMQINPDTTPMQGSNNVIDSNAVYEVEKLLPTDRESGESVDITNAQPYKVLNVVADGKHQQDSTTGKNLFDKDSPNIILNKYLDADGVMQNATRSSISDYIKVLPSTIYSMQPYNNVSQRLCFYNNEKIFISSIGLTSINPNFTTPNNCEYIRTSFITQEIDIWQIEQGSEATSYEPYTGGIPSPNPNYPQTITQVTSATWNRTGKNLFDKDKTPDNYYYNSSGTTTTDGTNTFINQEIKLSSKYVVSFTNKTGTPYVRFVEYDANNNFIQRTLINTNEGILTTNVNTKKVIISVDAGPISSFEKLQIEQGSTATPYSPYQGQTIPIDLDGNEVCATDTIKDKLLADRYGNVAIQKNVGKIVLNGSEIGIRNTYTNIDYATIQKPSDFLGYNTWDTTTIICSSATYLSVTQGTWDTANNVGKILGNATEKYWWVGFTKGTAQATMQTTLNNSIIYYPLATPTIIPLPKLFTLPTTLKGINHIWVDTNLGITDIEVEYVEDLSLAIPTSITDLTDIGFDATKTQVLKNVQGTIQWVDE